MQYTVKIKEFEGPLELLHGLIEQRKLAINEVSLGAVTEEYFLYLNKLREEKSESYHSDIASFLVIAATLMLIKSRSLLPGFEITKEEEEDIKELEDRLKTYKAVKEMAAHIGGMAKKRKTLYARAPSAHNSAVEFLPPAKPLDLQRMAALLMALAQSIPKKEALSERAIKKVVSIKEMIKDLENKIERGIVKSFSDFVGEKTEKLNVIVGFLAMLELIRIGAIAVEQSGIFDSIGIKTNKT